ncbi:hypothetical protein Kisp01_70070 [Kineosporia sp. NBRC 101677]|nr:hypothetical protein Kisp01_70070 [Kineosporia sp. NBRC 101677]
MIDLPQTSQHLAQSVDRWIDHCSAFPQDTWKLHRQEHFSWKTVGRGAVYQLPVRLQRDIESLDKLRRNSPLRLLDLGKQVTADMNEASEGSKRELSLDPQIPQSGTEIGRARHRGIQLRRPLRHRHPGPAPF